MEIWADFYFAWLAKKKKSCKVSFAVNKLPSLRSHPDLHSVGSPGLTERSVTSVIDTWIELIKQLNRI